MFRTLFCLALLTHAVGLACADDLTKARQAAERVLALEYHDLDLTPHQRQRIMAALVEEQLAGQRAAAARDKQAAPLLKALPLEAAPEEDELARLRRHRRQAETAVADYGRFLRGRSRPDDRELRRFGLDPERFATLELSEAQRRGFDKVTAEAIALIDEAYIRQDREGKHWEYDAWRAFAIRMRESLRPKIAALLDEEQRATFDQLNRVWDGRIAASYKRWLAQRGEVPSAELPAPPTPAEQASEQAIGLERSLQLKGSKAQLDELRRRLRALLEHRLRWGAESDRLAAALGAAASEADPETDALLKALRAKRAAAEAKQAELGASLSKLLDARQRALLVIREILR